MIGVVDLATVLAKRRPPRSTLELTVHDVAEQPGAHVIVHHGHGADVASLEVGRPVVVGRKRPADLVITDPTLSGKHAEFSFDGTTVTLRDLDSTNGCMVDGRAITEVTVDNDQEIRLGALLVTVHTTGDRKRAVVEEADRLVGDPIVRSPQMAAVYEMAQRVASSPLPILIHGETGVGKEVLARAIHNAASGGASPMRTLNCGAVPAQLLESALFGHEKGAFTGAEDARAGIFEDARDGTVLLDEIGELSAMAQIALLRVLESRTVRRLGGTEEIDIRARVIAATHRDLEALIEAGRFREDLYFRLNALTLTIPPLRDRTEEIIPLARTFARRTALREGLAVPELDDALTDWMKSYPWPGNVRELRNVIERGVLVSTGRTLGLDIVPSRARKKPSPPDVSGPLKDKVQDYERQLILDALVANGWNRSNTARQLKMPLRTLTSKIKSYGISPPSG